MSDNDTPKISEASPAEENSSQPEAGDAPTQNEPQADPLPEKSTALLDDKKPDNFDAETTEEKVKYPKSVFFIISNEFCERFSYYGMRTILVLYLQSILSYSEDDATVIYHVFAMLCYFFPILGSMIADSWLGKFRTIFYLSIVYALGNIVLSIASADEAINAPSRVLSIIGLLLIAFGTGGIKPCVSAFGGDQFKIPQQEKQMAQFFSLFYFAINSGSLLSTFITPILRDDVTCLDTDSCYPLAFGIPAILMVLSIIVFVSGKRLYVIKKPQGNLVLRVCRAMGHAICQKCKSKEKKEHWLDYADDKYPKNEIEDIKAALRVLYLYIPLPIFWTLFDQQGSRWTFQAKRMNGDLGGWSLKPDQMQVINPLLILIFIPLFETCVYPLLKKCNLLTRQLPRLVVGGVLAGVAFGASAILEWQLESTYAVLPGSGEAQLRVFNGLGCGPTNVRIGDSEPQSIEALAFLVQQSVSVTESNKMSITITYTDCGGVDKPLPVVVYEKKATTLILDGVNDPFFEDHIDKTNEANAATVRVVTPNIDPALVHLGDKLFNFTGKYSELVDMTPKTYDVLVDNDDVGSITLKVGGVYSLMIRKNGDGTGYDYKLNEITEPNTIHMLWLIPQYFIMTWGEVMYSVTGLEFSYSQSPLSMKSLMQAGWLLTVAVGNLIVVIIAEAKIFERQLFEFILFAGLMFLDMLIFALMAMGYKYVEVPQRDQDMALEKTKEKSGIDNKTFKSDEE